MKLLWFFLVIPAVLGQVGFGRSYLKNSRLCHQWNCINTKLGLPDSLPSKEVTEETLRRILPQGPWQDAVGNVLESCYGNRTRRYTNTCPGQALFHCIVDKMMDFCPEDNLRAADACSPVSSLAGLKYMFSQSRYYNLEVNLPKERRPEWFLKNYFDQKCCALPVMINSTILQECGFTSFIMYYNHEPTHVDAVPKTTTTTVRSRDVDAVHVVDFNKMPTRNPDISNTDPLDCCDMSEFIQPAWRSECDFRLHWDDNERLTISNNTPILTTEAPVTTTTAKSDPPKDLMLLPQSCEAETCIFRKLGILESDKINTLAFMKMLDNFTDSHPVWKKATARVVTKCLSRKVHDYDGSIECEINKVLACTLDLLTENCPYKRKMDDACRHHKQKTACQISSSKFRPKNRREVCLLPQLVNQDILHECGVDSLYKAEHVVVPDFKPKKVGWAASHYMCHEQTPSTTCLMSRMGILNKYRFMDYFGMKSKMRQFMANQTAWSAGLDLYMSAFINIPLYGKHCSSQKKLLNVIDAMLMTCPVSKRANTPQCTKMFNDIIHSTPINNQNATREKIDQILKHFSHVYLPTMTAKIDPVIRQRDRKNFRTPIYHHGTLDSKPSPKKFRLYNMKPNMPIRKPLVILPVYLRNKDKPTYFHQDTMYRRNPYFLP